MTPTSHDPPFGPRLRSRRCPAAAARSRCARLRAAPDVLCERLRQNRRRRAVGLLARRDDAGQVPSRIAHCGAHACCVVELRADARHRRRRSTPSRGAAARAARRTVAGCSASTALRILMAGSSLPGLPDERALRRHCPTTRCSRGPSVLRRCCALLAGLVGDSRDLARRCHPACSARSATSSWTAGRTSASGNPDPLDEPDFSFVLVGDAVDLRRSQRIASRRSYAVCRGSGRVTSAARADRLERLGTTFGGDPATASESARAVRSANAA